MTKTRIKILREATIRALIVEAATCSLTTTQERDNLAEWRKLVYGL